MAPPDDERDRPGGLEVLRLLRAGRRSLRTTRLLPLLALPPTSPRLPHLHPRHHRTRENISFSGPVIFGDFENSPILS